MSSPLDQYDLPDIMKQIKAAKEEKPAAPAGVPNPAAMTEAERNAYFGGGKKDTSRREASPEGVFQDVPGSTLYAEVDARLPDPPGDTLIVNRSRTVITDDTTGEQVHPSYQITGQITTVNTIRSVVTLVIEVPASRAPADVIRRGLADNKHVHAIEVVSTFKL